jgi:hypothetical protein
MLPDEMAYGLLGYIAKSLAEASSEYDKSSPSTAQLQQLTTRYNAPERVI